MTAESMEKRGSSAVQALFRDYIEEAERLEKERKPSDGLFGMSPKPADDPCHDRFADELEAALSGFAAGNPGPEEVLEVLSFVYHAPKEHQEPLSVFWMLNAVHGLTADLIPLLDPDDATLLRGQYDRDFPRRERLPVQKKVYEALKKKSRS